ncbi:hypothetical+protein [Methylocapsa aurea]
MSDSRRVFQLLDVPKFAYPSLSELDPIQTANNILDRLHGKSFMSYSRPLGLMPKIVRGEITSADIPSMFTSNKEEWKNVNQREVAKSLYDSFGGKGAWYPVSSKEIQVFEGLWFRPSVKGVWFDGKAPFMVAINPRKRQPLVQEHLAFLARGMHELYGIDDPNDPVPLILDLSVEGKSDIRSARKTIIREWQMFSLHEFEEIMRAFLEALRVAGIDAIPRELKDVTDIFRRPRS